MDAGSEFPAEGVERTATDLSENTPKRPRGEEEIVVGDINKLEAEMEGPSVKRSKVDNDEATDSTPPEEKYEHQDASGGQEGMDIDPSEKEEEEDDKTASKPDLMSPAFTRSRAYSKSEEVRTENSEPCEAFSTPLNDKTNSSTNGNAEINSGSSPGSEGRWRVHQMAEDYVDFVGKMMYPGTELRPYGFDSSKREYPIEAISVLGFLKSPLRRPSIIEKWSPYEIALFEAALLHHGKEFHLVSKEVRTKSTKDVIDFYYMWKKTAHYKKWKEQFFMEGELHDIDSPVKSPKI